MDGAGERVGGGTGVSAGWGARAAVGWGAGVSVGRGVGEGVAVGTGAPGKFCAQSAYCAASIGCAGEGSCPAPAISAHCPSIRSVDLPVALLAHPVRLHQTTHEVISSQNKSLQVRHTLAVRRT